MYIQIKIKGEDRELLNSLLEAGYKARMVKGAIIIDKPQKMPKLNGYEHSFLLHATESGGGMTNTGHAEIVCGLNGEKLRPYRIPKGYALDVHAMFSVPAPIYTVSADKKSGKIIIVSHEISWLDIINEIFWEGQIDELPESLSCFENACKAALEKANCYHCREPHFVLRGQ